MKRLVSQWIDRRVIQLAAARMPQPDGRDLQVREARELAENFNAALAQPKPAEVQFDDPIRFHFPTPRPSAHAVNNIVHGRLYRCGEDWKQKPSVVLLHGWNDLMDHHLYFPFHARRLNQLGMNAATLQLPWHFDREARELGAWGNFLNANLLHTIEGALQAIAEIRSFVDWLRREGCPFVGLWGVSLGGWLTGLTICSDPGVDAAVLAIPVARLDRTIQDVAFCETIRSALNGQPVDMRQLSLVDNQPVIPKENILLVEAEFDLFMPKETVEELWRAWDQPPILRFPAGHINILASPSYGRQVRQWLAAKACAPVAK